MRSYVVTLLHTDNVLRTNDPLRRVLSTRAREVLNEETFTGMIAVERKRTERSGEPFLLMLIETGSNQRVGKDQRAIDNIMSILPASIRETDIIGWYKNRVTIGLIFTGISSNNINSIVSTILNKVSTTLSGQLTPAQFDQVSISLHVFPDHWDQDSSGPLSNSTLYPDLMGSNQNSRHLRRVKQMIDIVGSALILILCAPLFAIIAAAIKTSSTGPVFFRQQRVGQHGRCFTFLKFRSMHTGNDQSVHKEYVTKLIAGEATRNSPQGKGPDIYKLTNDKRITSLGKVLRRTSLDELPQLINVLKGDMSLVGPRPAIPYELAAYQTWHRRRVLEVKPGITGLWQVSGRSKVKFDEMVRLDLRYATSWSLWLDLIILMRTPGAVVGGSGAA